MSDDSPKPAMPLTSCMINVDWACHVAPNIANLNPVNYAVRDALQQMAYQCWQFTTVNQLKKAIVAELGKVPQRLVNRTIG